MDHERRGTERKTPTEPSYIQLGEDSGGIVCNVSEAGLAFQLAAPLHGVKTIRTCISPNPSNRIDVTGTLVWTDGTSRFGGLQLTEIGAVAREQLRNWLTAISRSTAAVEERLWRTKQESIATGWFIGLDQGLFEKPPLQTPEKSKPHASQAGTVREHSPTLSVPLPSFSTRSAGWSRPFLAARIAAIAVWCCMLVATPIVLLHYFRANVASSLIRIGERLQVSPATSVTPALPSSSGSTQAVTLPAPPIRPAAPRESRSFTHTNQPATEPALARRSVRTEEHLQSRNLRTGLAGSKARRKRPGVSGQSATAQAFWGAVGRGDVSAEVALAELYMNGDGVARNCEQARVLLRAAVEKGNGDAARLLEHIRKAGCR